MKLSQSCDIALYELGATTHIISLATGLTLFPGLVRMARRKTSATTASGPGLVLIAIVCIHVAPSPGSSRL